MINKVYIALAIAAISSAATWRVCSWHHDSEQLKLKTQLEELQNERDKHANESIRLALENERIINETADRIGEDVIRYVPSDFRPTNQFVCIYNRAVQVTAATCASDDSPSETTTDRDLLANVTKNLRICNLERNRLAGLQSWVEAQTE